MRTLTRFLLILLSSLLLAGCSDATGVVISFGNDAYRTIASIGVGIAVISIVGLGISIAMRAFTSHELGPHAESVFKIFVVVGLLMSLLLLPSTLQDVSRTIIQGAPNPLPIFTSRGDGGD